MSPEVEALIARRRQERREYEEAMLRWLRMKRDYPWNNEPEPQAADLFVGIICRDQIIREFHRTL